MHLDAEAMAALLSSAPLPSLEHLVGCARCRRRISEVVGSREELETGQRLASSRAAETSRAILLRAVELARESEAGSLAAASEDGVLYDQLFDIAPEGRAEAIRRGRFRSLGLAEILISAAAEAAADDPPRSGDLAGLAAAVLERLEEQPGKNRLEALASCHLGEAERRRARPDIADDFFRQSADGLREEPLTVAERVPLCRFWAALRREQGRLDEALGLLNRGAALAEELGAFEDWAWIRLAVGWIFLEELEPERARLPLIEARAEFESGDIGGLLSALQALALVYAELGEEELREEVEVALEKLRTAGLLDEVRFLWIRAQILARLGRRVSAISTLEEVLNRRVKEGPGHEAALAGLEIADLLVEDGDDPVVPGALEEIAGRLEAMTPDQLPSHLRAALLFALRFAKGKRGAFREVLLSAAAYVERGRFNPAVAFHPLAEPDLLLGWRELTSQQRRQAASAAGVEVDRLGEPRNREDLRLISWTHEALTGARIELPDPLPNRGGEAS